MGERINWTDARASWKVEGSNPNAEFFSRKISIRVRLKDHLVVEFVYTIKLHVYVLVADVSRILIKINFLSFSVERGSYK